MRGLGAFVALAISGCASLPDVTYSYYPVRWSASVTVLRTVACDASKTELIALHAATISASYSSDQSRPPFTIRVKDLDRFAADTDFSMTFTEDGRLKSINQSSTGQGEAVFKSLIALESAIGARTMALRGETDAPRISMAQCDDLDKWGDKKPVTLVYRTSIDATKLGATVPVSVSPESAALHSRLASFLPPVQVKLESAGTPYLGGVSQAPGHVSGAMVPVRLQKMASLPVTVTSGNDRVGSSRLLIPLTETYELPIPKAALFGRQVFSLALADSGALTSAGYGRTTGAAGAMNAVAAWASSQSAATEAAELRAQADFIAQQQRLMTCLTKPEQCK